MNKFGLKKMTVFFAVLLVLGVVTNAIATIPPAADEQAEKILAQARAAIGDEAKLKAVESLYVEGTYKREVNSRTTDGDLNFYLNRSGQYVRNETLTPPQGGKVIFERGLDGEKGWLKPRAEGSGDIQFTGFDDEKAQTEERDKLLIEYPLQLFTFLLVAPPSHIDFTYAGKTTDGATSFEVVEARGQKGFAARLFFESDTHRLAKVSYRGHFQRPMKAKRMNQMPDGSLVPADGDAAAAEDVKAVQGEEIALTVSDYKAVDGVMLPHRLTRAAAADGASETWEIKAIKLNAPKAGGLK